MTACPCAQEIMRDMASKELLALNVDEQTVSRFLKNMPMPTHNQRGRGIISIRTNGNVRVSLDQIIEIIEHSMSSSIYELLKREDEAYVVETAHRNPKFVEDCVRAMAQNVVDSFDYLPDDAVVTIKQINEESIHRHNAFAERVAKFGDLKAEIRKA
jgi:GTP cyclohydrolase-4